jgi:hypothetical protein
VEDEQTRDESSYFVSPRSPRGGIALSDSEKSEAHADGLETQCQPVTDPSVPVVEMVDMALRPYLRAPASEPNITNPEQVQEAIRGLKVSKVPAFEASPTASAIPSCPDFQRGPPHPSLSYSVEAR